MKRFLSSTLFSTVFIILFSITAYAAPATVTVNPGVPHIPQEKIEALAKDYPDTHITIINYQKSVPNITPNIWWFDLTEKKTTQTDVLAKNKFVISVARGATKTLSKTWSGSISPSCSFKAAFSTLELGATITRSYSKSETFSGPPEGSPYNTREYRVKFYEDRGTFKGYYVSDAGNQQKKSGTWKSPSYYFEYSVDRYAH